MARKVLLQVKMHDWEFRPLEVKAEELGISAAELARRIFEKVLTSGKI